MKTVLVLSDTHCGHMAGLTPPGYQADLGAESHIRRKFANWQRSSWEWFEQEITKIGPIDVLFHLGDWLEGKGERSGATELVSADRIDQIAMGEKVFELVKPRTARFVFGTASHVGKDEDWEQLLADKLDVEIGSHSWPQVEGVTFDLKHKVGSSAVPYGRNTAISRSRVWNELLAERDLQPNCNVLLRGHVHYWKYSGGSEGLNMTLPALQGWGSKYGSRECEGIVNYGFMVFYCEEGKYAWQEHLMNLKPFAPKIDVL
jgi:hypothetical protein